MKALIAALILVASTNVGAQYTTHQQGNGYRIQNDWDVRDSYTVTPNGNGSYRIQNDWNVWDSKTVRPTGTGGYKIQNDWNVWDSKTIIPR